MRHEGGADKHKGRKDGSDAPQRHPMGVMLDEISYHCEDATLLHHIAQHHPTLHTTT
jgi:hypothetical protein